MTSDPRYGCNPLIDQYRVAQPRNVQAAAKGGAEPTLAPQGDLPGFTASGMPVAQLRVLPWHARHPAASAPTLAAAAKVVEEVSGPGGADWAELFFGGHEGNRDYQQRVDAWLMGAAGVLTGRGCARRQGHAGRLPRAKVVEGGTPFLPAR